MISLRYKTTLDWGLHNGKKLVALGLKILLFSKERIFKENISSRELSKEIIWEEEMGQKIKRLPAVKDPD